MFNKFKNLFATKGKVLVTGTLLIVSILAAAVGTFAWFTVDNHAVDQATLKSEGNSLIVDAYAYKQGVDTTNPVPNAYNKNNGTQLFNATKTDHDSQGAWNINFSSSVLSGFTYSQLYDHELSMSEGNFPHVYFELRYIKPVLEGFVKANINSIAYVTAPTGYTDMTSSLDYQCRFITVQNTDSSRYTSGLTAAYANITYRKSAWTSITSSTSTIELYSAENDLTGYNYDQSLTPLDQCYIPGYNVLNGTDYYYSKATLVEFRIDPEKWTNYFKTHTPNDASKLSFGITCTISVEFSTDAYFSTNKVPKIILDRSRLNTAVNATAAIGFSTYNFTGTPTVTVSNPNTAIASGAISGNTLNVTIGATTGITIITLTASYATASESAQASLTVHVYDGPTVIVAPTTLTLPAGETSAVTTEYVLFSAQPTYTVATTADTIATAVVDTDNVTIQVTGVAAGTATITVTGTNGTETSSATIAVTVAAGAKSISYITANTTGMPTTTFILGSAFNTTGLAVTATFNDGTTANVAGFSTNPANGDALNTAGSINVMVTYTGLTTTFVINVAEEASFSLVTSTTQLRDGAKYVIGSSSNGSAKLLSVRESNGDTTVSKVDSAGSTYLTNNYYCRYATSANAIVDSTLTLSASVSTDAARIIIAPNNGTYYLNALGGSYPGYLHISSSSDKTKLIATPTLADNDATAHWNITFQNNLAYIQNVAYPSYYLKWLNRYSEYKTYTIDENSFPALFVQNSLNQGPSISLSKKTMSIAAGETDNSTATLGNGATISGVESSDPSIAVPTFSGATVTVHALSIGTCIVNVTAQNDVSTITGTISVTVTAATKHLDSIALTSLPTTTTYTIAGENEDPTNALDLTGMVVTATYINNDAQAATTTEIVTSQCIVSPISGTPLTSSTQYIYVSYTFLGVTKMASFVVTVTNGTANLSASLLTITTMPTKARYLAGSAFDSTGLVATATYSDNSTAEVYSNVITTPGDESTRTITSLTGFSMSTPDGTLVHGTTLSTVGNITVTASYTYGGINVKTTFVIEVISKNWTLVTDQSQIVAGKRIIICTSNYSGTAYAMGTTMVMYRKSTTVNGVTTVTYSNSGRKGVSVTINSGINPTVTPPEDAGGGTDPWLSSTLDVFTIGGISNAWTLKSLHAVCEGNYLSGDFSNGYLYAGGANNPYLSTSHTDGTVVDTLNDAEITEGALNLTWRITVNTNKKISLVSNQDTITKITVMYDTGSKSNYPLGRFNTYATIYDDLLPLYFYMEPTV